MGHQMAVLLLGAFGVPGLGAAGQSCDPTPWPGPPLIQHDLSDLRGQVALGPDGVVRHADGRDALLPDVRTDVIELGGEPLDRPDRVPETLVRCASSILACVTGPESLRLHHLETGATHDSEVLLDSASIVQVSDGSVWYRLRSRPVTSAGAEWYRLDVGGGVALVRLRTDVALIDAYDEIVLVREREPDVEGRRAGRIIARPPGSSR